MAPAQGVRMPDTALPSSDWIKAPSDGRWNKAVLDEAWAYAEKIQSAAIMVVEGGRVVASWGDLERRFMCHSIRKSFLSALYGIHVAEGRIDLGSSLAELGIDDAEGLSGREKSATILDLLSARSGIY